jgi:hypothetical protein
MVLSVDVTQYTHGFDRKDIGRTRDAFTAKLLRQHAANTWFANPKISVWPADFSVAPGFDWFVRKYAEVILGDPWRDVELYFNNAAALQGANPLGYPPRHPLLNTAAMAMAAEALAGWFCETNYPWAFIGRPQRVSPDLIFYDRAQARYVLIEVKSSGRETWNVRAKLTTDMINLLRTVAPTKHLTPSKYVAGVIAIQVIGPAAASLSSLILEEA